MRVIKNRKTWLAATAVVLLLIVPILIGVCSYSLHLGKEEKLFMSAAEQALKVDGDTVFLKELTDFEWNRVCYWEVEPADPFIPPIITKNLHEQKLIRRNYRNLIFLNQERLIKVLGYKGSETIEIGGKKYGFSSRYRGDSVCVHVDSARFIAETIDTKCCGMSYGVTLDSHGE